MNRAQLKEHILTTYLSEYDEPWAKWPDNGVFPHPGNKKWFALVTKVDGSKIGLDTDKPVDIVNLKGDPLLINALVEQPGYHRAWHMNKEHWITAELSAIDDDQLLALVEMSFDATAPRRS